MLALRYSGSAGMPSVWLCLLAFVACIALTPWQSKAQSAPAAADGGMIDRLRNLVSPPDPLNMIDMPECLVALTGGIEAIEDTLSREMRHGKTWTVLITSKNDRTSIPAVQQYYEAVRLMCGEEAKKDAAGDGELESSSGAFSDDINAATNTPSSPPIIVDLDEVREYRFAHLSFDEEPGMMWRWWIWKVPIVVFISSSTDPDNRLYDAQFWKVAWGIPSTSTIIAVCVDKTWRTQLDVWKSLLAPGAPMHHSTKYLALGFGQVYKVLDPIPNWLLGIGGSFLGSVLLSYMHRGDRRTASPGERPASGVAAPSGVTRKTQ